MIFQKKRIGIFSDLHLGVHQNNPAWHTIAINYAYWLKETFNKHNIEDIMFCGDWFHHRDEINVSTMDVASKILQILEDFNIVMIPGNHDCYLKNNASINSLSIFKGRQNIKIFDNLHTTNIFGRKVTFVPWGVPVNTIPDSDVVFGHFELANFQINNFKICDHGEDYNDLLKHASITFTGHFHLNQEKVFDNGKIIYVGNTFQMDFGDAERKKYVYIYNFETNSYEYIENTISPKHHLIKISDLADNEFNIKIRESVGNNIIRLCVDKKIHPDEINKISIKLSQLKPLGFTVDYKLDVDKIEVNTTNETNLQSIDIPTMIDEYINLMEIENKGEVRKYVNNLYKDCLK